jgi:hypothetical protein
MARRRKGLEAFALDALAFHFTGAANRFGGLTGAAFARLLVMPAQFHFAKNTLALEFLFERLEGLIDVIVANENLHLADNS